MNEHPFAAIWYPSLPAKPRTSALTSVLDKGLGPAQVTDLVSTAGEWIDVVKFGWGTARLQPEAVLSEKIRRYREAGIAPCTGGTFLEVAYAQNRLAEFLNGAERIGFQMVEVSNGVHPMSGEEKATLIRQTHRAGFRVWSEVGKKDSEEDARMSLNDRLEAIAADLDAGADRVILEARESGSVGIYDRNGKPAAELLHRIVERFGHDQLVFEAPRKEQQLWMIRTFGPEVNLGNVPSDDAIPLATLRTGLRGDTVAEVHLDGVEVYVELGVSGALRARERGGVVVMIDALRASATVVTALARGMTAVRPVAMPEECVGEVTAGERGGRKLPNVRHGNSPVELLREDYEGRSLTLTTTNGTECLMTASGPRNLVLVGTTLNCSAVADTSLRLAREHGGPITLLMAGRNNQFAIEDALAAGEIFRAMRGAHLRGDPLPTAHALEPEFFVSDSGRNLVELGYEADVRFCARLDMFDVVPVYRNGLLVRMD